jgi:hypothetical protein
MADEDSEEPMTTEYRTIFLHQIAGMLTSAYREIREVRAFQLLLKMCPELKDKLLKSADDEIREIAESVSPQNLFTLPSMLSSCLDSEGCQQCTF